MKIRFYNYSYFKKCGLTYQIQTNKPKITMETKINMAPANIPRGLNFSLRLTADNSLAGINI